MSCGVSPFSDFTVDPVGVDCEVEPPPVRTAEEPVTLPPVSDPGNDPLVRVETIESLGVYHQACLPGAVEGVWLRSSVVKRLESMEASLPCGLKLAIFDGWRPLALQRFLYADAVARVGTATGFVSEPSDDPTRPSPHLTGGAVDLTLSVDGAPLALGTCFDAFVPEAAVAAFEGTPGIVRRLRRLLHDRMAKAGFVPLLSEWWHFEFGTPRWAAHRGVDPLFGPAVPGG